MSVKQSMSGSVYGLGRFAAASDVPIHLMCGIVGDEGGFAAAASDVPIHLMCGIVGDVGGLLLLHLMYRYT